MGVCAIRQEGGNTGSAVERVFGRIVAGELRGIFGGMEHGKRQEDI
jgi:hypothetical protein